MGLQLPGHFCFFLKIGVTFVIFQSEGTMSLTMARFPEGPGFMYRLPLRVISFHSSPSNLRHPTWYSHDHLSSRAQHKFSKR